ncbi:MAG: nitronate monooxygenase [Pseudomonadota bacterium]
MFVRRLQMGDVGEHLRRAVKAFPVPEIAERIYRKYFRPSGKAPLESFKRLPMLSAFSSLEAKQLLVLSNFVEIFLAKEGHKGAVGINYLEKIQMATLASLYGAMLAGAGVVLMGAGIPREIPGAIAKLARHETADLRLAVAGSMPGDDYRTSFSPLEVLGNGLLTIDPPRFFAIISSSALALTLAKKATGVVDGFVIEGPTAGGHNAPPRGEVHRNERGEPVYGAKDEVDLARIQSLGLPYWLAGSYGSPEGLRVALELGAEGIQVGTPFALCRESSLSEPLKAELLREAMNGGVDVFTDAEASPTGFPFKVARLPGTMSQGAVYAERHRVCDMGYLRTPYRKENGNLGYRCPAEPESAFVAKGGKLEETVGRKCLCNSLLANIDLGQVQKDGAFELPLVTIGDNVNQIKRFVSNGNVSYTAADVIRTILG